MTETATDVGRKLIAGTDIVPLASRPEYDGPRYEDPVELSEADIDAMFAADGVSDQTDETWDYMTDLLEAGEIDPDSFRNQMLSVGYAEDEISEAIADAASSRSTGEA